MSYQEIFAKVLGKWFLEQLRKSALSRDHILLYPCKNNCNLASRNEDKALLKSDDSEAQKREYVSVHATLPFSIMIFKLAYSLGLTDLLLLLETRMTLSGTDSRVIIVRFVGTALSRRSGAD